MSDVVGVGVPTTRNNEIVKFGIIFARLVAYAVFQNKYICHFIIFLMPDIVGGGRLKSARKKYLKGDGNGLF